MMPRAGIITIPAMFETPQREATARAGRLAGFDHCQLLQEPVAAAVAYGFRSNADKAFWLVYDFGGGTFDASIVAVRDGQLAVVDHAGDNYLGGSDFDWVIVEQVLIPHLRDEYDLPTLSRETDDPGVRAQLYKLKAMAERLKIDLSRSEEADLTEDAVFEDESGKDVDIDVSLSREEYNELISGMVSQSIRMVEGLLEKAKLSPGDIDKVLLVGGSTFTPHVRESVEKLGIVVDYDVDPMTVVAKGAAIFAASQQMPDNLAEVALPASQAHLKLEFQPVTKDISPLVGGKLSLAGGAAPDAATSIEIRRDDDGWSSGSIPLESGGMFFSNVMMLENQACTFSIRVEDSRGNTIATSPSSFTITHGLSVAKAILPQSIRLVKYDGTTDLLISKGTQLSASIDGHRVHTAKSLAKGDRNDVLHIPFCEGEEELADRDRIGGRIIIRGDQIERSLPEGTELEINAEVDESGVLHYRVFIPMLDEEFEIEDVADQASEIKHEPPDVMENRLKIAENNLAVLEKKAHQVNDAAAQEQLEAIRSNERLAEIRTSIAAWSGGDRSGAGRARNQLVELAKELDNVEDLVEWPALLVEYRESLDDIRRVVHEYGDDRAQHALTGLEQEGDQAIAERDPKMLKRAKHDLDSLASAILLEDPGTWAAWLHHIVEELHVIADQTKAQSLAKEGQQAMERGDVPTLQSVVRELLSMMPREAADRVQVIRSDVR